MPSYLLTAKGVDLQFGTFVASICWLGATFTNPLGGWISDKIGKRKPVIIVGALGCGLTMIAFPFLGSNSLLLILWAIVINAFDGLVVGPVFAISAGLLGPSSAGLGLGMLSTCWNIGLTLFPLIFGFVLDLTGNFNYGFVIVALAPLLAATLIYKMKIG